MSEKAKGRQIDVGGQSLVTLLEGLRQDVDAVTQALSTLSSKAVTTDSLAQSTGNDTTVAMSQKAVTTALAMSGGGGVSLCDVDLNGCLDLEPVVPGEPDDLGTEDNGDGTITVSGHTEPGYFVDVYDDTDTLAQSTQADSEGFFTFTLLEGPEYYLVIRDLEGTTSGHIAYRGSGLQVTGPLTLPAFGSDPVLFYSNGKTPGLLSQTLMGAGSPPAGGFSSLANLNGGSFENWGVGEVFAFLVAGTSVYLACEARVTSMKVHLQGQTVTLTSSDGVLSGTLDSPVDADVPSVGVTSSDVVLSSKTKYTQELTFSFYENAPGQHSIDEYNGSLSPVSLPGGFDIRVLGAQSLTSPYTASVMTLVTSHAAITYLVVEIDGAKYPAVTGPSSASVMALDGDTPMPVPPSSIKLHYYVD